MRLECFIEILQIMKKHRYLVCLLFVLQVCMDFNVKMNF